MKQYYVYILGNKTDRLYIGVTSDLVKRIYQHRNKLVERDWKLNIITEFNPSWQDLYQQITN